MGLLTFFWPSTPALEVSAEQALIMGLLDTYLHQAWSAGTSSPGHPTLIPLMTGYNSLTPPLQQTARYAFEAPCAAFLLGANIQGFGIDSTDPLAKITGLGANGSLTFSNGILTAYTPPS